MPEARPLQAAASVPVPMTVIGGFLGAGKTTLLQHWLVDAPTGLRIAVLVNDFGAINIDAALVARRDGDQIALSNGCVCCSIGDDLSQALQQLLARPTPFDAIVVEASGVADPWRIAQYALADPQLCLAGVVVLVDAAAVLHQLADPLLTSSLTTPLKHADLVLLNKADLAGPAVLLQVQHWVTQQAGPVPVMATTQARLPWQALHALGGYQPHGGGLHSRPAAHDQRFESWCLQPSGTFDPTRLRQWLRTLPPQVLRLKGLLPDGQQRWWVLQWAGRHGRLQPASSAQVAAADGAAVVAIGLAGQLPTDLLASGLQDCLKINTEHPLNGLPSAL